MPLSEDQRSVCRSQIEPWRDEMVRNPISGTPNVVFAIPLISKERAHNWDQVCTNLSETIETLRRQTNPNWQAVICCQSEPDGIAFDDQVVFLPFTEPVDGKDNKQKRQAIARHCSKVMSCDAYFFVLDADDYVHPDLVGYMVKTRSPSGYLIDRGYLFDISIGKLAPLNLADRKDIRAQQGALRLGRIPIRLDHTLRKLTGRGFRKQTPRLWKMKSFDSSCGSCVAWRYRFDPDHPNPPEIPGFDHRLIRPANEDGLMQLHHVPFNAVVYVVGHGENLQKVKGRLHLKSRYIEEFKLPEHETRQILATFGVG